MYYTNINQPLNTHKIFSAGIKMYEYLKLSLKPGMYKNTDNKEWLSFFLTMAKDLTVIDIGIHSREYLFDMIKVANHSATLIAFEPDAAMYNYLLRMKQWLKLHNVTVENFSLSRQTAASLISPTKSKNNARQVAPVIDIKEITNKKRTTALSDKSLDTYFTASDIKPDLLKIKTDGSELEILTGCIRTLEIYKPKILLECRETQRSRERLLATFEFLKDLHYHGYFILDTMKIPLANFDFNIYQNEFYGFYCNNFLFE